MKTIRSFILSLFLLLNFTMLGQVLNPPHWVFGVSAGSEFLYPNTETNPIGVTYGIFQQFKIKKFSIAAGVTYGQREIYDKLINIVSLTNLNFTSVRTRNYHEKSITADLFLKYYPLFLQEKRLFFIGMGIQIKDRKDVRGSSTTMNTPMYFPNYTVDLSQFSGLGRQTGCRIAIGLDHFMNERIFFSGKLGWNFFFNQNDSDVDSKNLTYVGGNNNIFFEIQLGYNFRKTYSLFDISD